MLQTKNHTLTPSFVVFTLGLAFESFEEFGGASKPTTKVTKSYRHKRGILFCWLLVTIHDIWNSKKTIT
jgi:uncharacterized membrane protein YoaK (UPF0700 family)